MFTLSQIVGGQAKPGNVLSILLGLGLVLILWRRWRRPDYLMKAAASVLLVLTMVLPVGAWLLSRPFSAPGSRRRPGSPR